MRLEPVYNESAGSRKTVLPAGAVEVGAAQQQLIGLRTAPVERAAASHVLRFPGRITVDERRLHRIVAGVDGWMRKLGDNSAGTFVKQNEVMGSYYVPNLIAIQQSLIYTLRTVSDLQRDPETGLQVSATGLALQNSLDGLRTVGMSDIQMEELQRTKKLSSEIRIYSPITGFVISRSVTPGQRFEKGAELYRIADIGHVWAMTDIFEKDREFIKPGAMATIRYQGRKFPARMSNVLPQLDPQSRTLRSRFEVENHGDVLRPDVFVDVEIEVRMPAAVTVPADAVIDSGRRKTVFLARGNGVFEPRVVETGWRVGDRVQIVKGVDAGESIVVSGNFLIDSESRMKLPAANPAPAPKKETTVKDPVCGMDVDPKEPGVLKTQHGGKTYYFCAEHCKKTFEADPGKFGAAAPAPAPKKEPAVKDPVCGMDVDPQEPGVLKTQHGGKTYYFCAEHCKKTFEADPGKFGAEKRH
jgi:Cu(I)/Ag(I) efflux system membrane fusion protein